jgi:hypothetical protein
VCPIADTIRGADFTRVPPRSFDRNRRRRRMVEFVDSAEALDPELGDRRAETGARRQESDPARPRMTSLSSAQAHRELPATDGARGQRSTDGTPWDRRSRADCSCRAGRRSRADSSCRANRRSRAPGAGMVAQCRQPSPASLRARPVETFKETDAGHAGPTGEAPLRRDADGSPSSTPPRATAAG